MINKKTISIFVPHLGCVHDCVFCNQKRITGQNKRLSGDDVRLIIEEQLNTIKASTIELAFFGGSFTVIDLSLQVEFLEAVQPFIYDGKIDYIKVSTRPDAINEEELELLKKHHVKIIELGVQSLDEKVLFLSNRGHDASCVFTASEQIKAYGFELGLQMMLGLPKDSRQTILNTAMDFVKINPQYVRIYPVLVIKDTALAEDYQIGNYRPMSLDTTVDMVSDLIRIFERNCIKILRIGLQTSDDISLEGSVVAGPFHSSIGELCYSRFYRKLLDEKLSSLGVESGVVKLKVWKKYISKFIGNNKINIEYFKLKGISLQVMETEVETWEIHYENNVEKFEIKI